MKFLCKDRHYRRFSICNSEIINGIEYETFTCNSCNETIYEDGFFVKLKNHTCKARLKELKIISQPESPAA